MRTSHGLQKQPESRLLPPSPLLAPQGSGEQQLPRSPLPDVLKPSRSSLCCFLSSFWSPSARHLLMLSSLSFQHSSYTLLGVFVVFLLSPCLICRDLKSLQPSTWDHSSCCTVFYFLKNMNSGLPILMSLTFPPLCTNRCRVQSSSPWKILSIMQTPQVTIFSHSFPWPTSQMSLYWGLHLLRSHTLSLMSHTKTWLELSLQLQ